MLTRTLAWSQNGNESEAKVRTSQLVELRRIRESARQGATREARLRAGLSLSEIAVALRVSKTTVSRWERGLRRPTGAAALRYARLHEILVHRDTEDHGEPQT